MPPTRPSARSKVVATLAREITRHQDTEPFMIESENELCARFGFSRVTIRLALAELENQGLIFREHGRGTFASGKKDVAQEIVMSVSAWQKLDRVRGKKSRGEWIAAQLRKA